MKRSEYCSFCGEHENNVTRLFDGPAMIAICNECVELMHGMISEPRREPIQIDEFRKRLTNPPEGKP